MTLAKLFNALNGGFYVLFGLYWAFLPKNIGKAFDWDVSSVLGRHEMRAYGMCFFAIGMIILGGVMRRMDQRPVVLGIIFITLAFLTGRLLGLVLDGPGPMLTYYEMGLEVVIVALGLFVFRSSAPKTLT